MFKIKMLNNISSKGLNEFQPERYQIAESIENPDAILVRSFKMHNLTISRNLQIVGRAGAGINNIPVKQFTNLGIPVLNTPGANANAVKELVITGMLLACRNICAAWNYIRHLEGDNATITKQVEKNKKQFAGFELPGKTLGIIGLGHIGVKVANAAIDLGMNVIGYDPNITIKNAWQLSSQVQQANTLDEVLAQSDFITLHIPLNDNTQHLINADRLKKMKPQAILLNFARDGIIDNNALSEALMAHQVKMYVCDFPNALFINNPNVICLPHLGASTREAEENCAIMIAQQVKNYLENGEIYNSVNFPTVKMPRNEGHRIAIINKNIPTMVTQVSLVLSESNHNIIDMINKSKDDIAYTLIDSNKEPSHSIIEKLNQIEGVLIARKIPQKEN